MHESRPGIGLLSVELGDGCGGLWRVGVQAMNGHNLDYVLVFLKPLG